METIRLLNAQISDISLSEILEKIKLGGVVFTPNVDHLVKLQKDSDFYQIYEAADYKICDSQIILYASKFLGAPIREKISGSDFFPAFYHHYRHDENVKIFLLGAKEGIAKKAQEIINQKLERDIIVAAHSPSFGFEDCQDECQYLVDLINRSQATVLAIGVGSPKQEKWIYQYKSQLEHVQIFLAIGATIDFEAGEVSRAPRRISNLGLEWLYRLIREPKRLWRRYLVDDLVFFWLILKQKINRYQDPFVDLTESSFVANSTHPVCEPEQPHSIEKNFSQLKS